MRTVLDNSIQDRHGRRFSLTAMAALIQNRLKTFSDHPNRCTEFTPKFSHAGLQALQVIVADATCIRVQESPYSALQSAHYERTQEDAWQYQKERIEGIKNSLDLVVQVAFHAERALNRDMLHWYFEKKAGGVFEALQDRVRVGNKATGEGAKLHLDFFVFLDSPAPKNPFNFLHQKVFEKSAKGLARFLWMERIE